MPKWMQKLNWTMEIKKKKLFPPGDNLQQPKESARVPPAARIWNFSFEMCSLQVCVFPEHTFFKCYATAALKPTLEISPAFSHFVPSILSIALPKSHPCALSQVI